MSIKLAVYHGFICERLFRDNEEALFIGGMDKPLALAFHDEYGKGLITVRYWVSDKQKTKIELQEGVLKKYFGALDCEYYDRYSEMTGYLWTDEELKLGGYDLLNELRSHIGKYIYLEIEVHEQTIEFEMKKETQEFKRGDHILCWRGQETTSTNKEACIFITYIEGAKKPYVVVQENQFTDYKEGNKFEVCVYDNAAVDNRIDDLQESINQLQQQLEKLKGIRY